MKSNKIITASNHVLSLSMSSLPQLCVFVLIFYNFYYIRIFSIRPIIHWVALLGLIITSFSTNGIEGVICLHDKRSRLLWEFVLTSAITTIVVCLNYQNAFKAIIDNFEYAIIFSAIVQISKRKGCLWIIKTVVFVVALCGVTAILQNNTLYERLILGTTGNPNDLGIKMVYACCCVFLMSHTKNKAYYVIGFILLALFSFVIIRTGSRKSLFAAVAIVPIWSVFIFPKRVFEKNKLLSVFCSVIIVGIIVWVVSHYWMLFEQTKIYRRFTYLADGVEDRWYYYKVAFEIFKEKPIFGVGLNNFKNYSNLGLYSHSTIAETLSCTGVVGTIVFFRFFLSFLFSLQRVIILFWEKNRIICVSLVMLFLTITFFCFSVILYYDFSSMLMMAIFASIMNTLLIP